MSYQKYRNKRVECDGRVFDSLKEYRRYCQLKMLLKCGAISDLNLQVPFELIPAVYEDVVKQLKTKTKVEKKCVQRAIRYVADFVYMRDGNMIVEDVKGSDKMITPEFRLKQKLMRYRYGIEIKIYK